MAWLNPAFMSYNAAIDSPNVAANPWTATGTIETDYPVTNLHDLRAQTQCRWTSAATTHAIDLDRGSGSLINKGVNALVLGNVSPIFFTMKVESDNDVAFGSPTTVFTQATVTPTNPWNFYPLTSTTEERYLRISFPVTSITPQIGQIWFTYYEEMTRGPVQNWQQVLDTDRSILPSGASLLNRTSRDRIGLEWRKLDSDDASRIRHVVDGRADASAATTSHDGNRPVLVRYPYGSATASSEMRLMNVTRFEETADVEVPADDDYLARITAEFTETHQ